MMMPLAVNMVLKYIHIVNARSRQDLGGNDVRPASEWAASKFSTSSTSRFGQAMFTSPPRVDIPSEVMYETTRIGRPFLGSM